MTRTPPPGPLPGLGAGPASPAPAPFNIEALLASAIQAHEAGRAAEAERSYRLLQTMAPRDARIPAHLAVLLLEQGRNAEAIPLLDQSLALDPRQPGMLTNKGNALIALDRFAEALAAYEQAIALSPEGQRPAGFVNLGVYLESLKRHDEAAEAYAKAAALDPEMAEAWGNLGGARLSAGRAAEALEALDRAVALRPDYSDAWINRGTALQGLGRLDEALESIDRALALQPRAPGAWSNRSNALHDMKRFDEALEASARAVALDGSHADSLNNHGVALQDLGRVEEAMAAYDKAVSADPGGSGAWSNRGLALQAMGRIDDALESYDRALALKSEFPDALWNKALLLLSLGEYEEGWKLFEWRWKRSGGERPADFGSPPWLGQTPLAAGQTLLLHAEQGYGDTIQMLRYAPLLADRGLRVTLICPEPLLELADTVRGLAEPARNAGPAAFDAHIPLMSLPLALGTRLESVPREVPYVSVPEAARAAWADRLGPSARRRVGLAWSGNPEHRNDRNRSLPFAALGPLLAADVELHSLQKDYRPGEREALQADGRVIDHSAELHSFSDAAALIDRMDLVVSVDTASAHLAGALGKPVVVLLPYSPDFRWGLSGPDTAWYPTARLLRQQEPGQWGPVLDEAAGALK